MEEYDNEKTFIFIIFYNKNQYNCLKVFFFHPGLGLYSLSWLLILIIVCIFFSKQNIIFICKVLVATLKGQSMEGSGPTFNDAISAAFRGWDALQVNLK